MGLGMAECYKTADFYRGVWLLVNDIDLKGIERVDGRRVRFVFDNDPAIHRLMDAYDEHDVTVPLHRMVTKIKFLKQQMYAVLDGEDGNGVE
jgi:hypothetical protein